MKILLYPFSLLYGIGVGFRNLLFDIGILKSKSFQTPIISIGNITVGGTGKTPHAEYIVSILQQKHKVAVLSRGYKRSSKGFELATVESTTAEIGDELKQIKSKFPSIIVAADADRRNGIKEIESKSPENEAIILDDAYQHRKVNAGLSILLIDFSRPLNNDFLLPAGRLRESPKQIKRADIVIVTKVPPQTKPFDMRSISNTLETTALQQVYFSTLKYGSLSSIFPSYALHLNIDICKQQNYTCFAVSGLANPSSFHKFVNKHFKTSQTKIFPDHHKFTLSDIEAIKSEFKAIENQNKIVLLTEKDAVKIKEVSKISNDLKTILFYIPIEITILNEQAEEFNQQIFKFVSNG